MSAATPSSLLDATRAGDPARPELRLAPEAQLGVLRFATAGSVDDGKSTLVGRLLFDTRALFRDQVAKAEAASRRRGAEETDLALVCDGLRAEREQGITIDVAWRYFATVRRRFVLGDAPGHEQYTRNMATAASAADVAVVLVDAQKGLLEQTRRHLAICATFGVPEILLAVNKMDLVGWDGARFEALAAEASAFARALGRPAITAVPISAKEGDNVATRSSRAPFYDGPSVLERLETARPAASLDEAPLRLAVQWVLRTTDRRAYAGRVAQGTVAEGDRVWIGPSEREAVVTRVDASGERVGRAGAGRAVLVELDRDVDVSRGDWLAPAAPAARPTLGTELSADVLWLSRRPLASGARLALKHGARRTLAIVERVEDRLDLATGARAEATSAIENDIVRARLATAEPLAWDAFDASRGAGHALLVEPTTAETVGVALFRR